MRSSARLSLAGAGVLLAVSGCAVGVVQAEHHGEAVRQALQAQRLPPTPAGSGPVQVQAQELRAAVAAHLRAAEPGGRAETGPAREASRAAP